MDELSSIAEVLLASIEVKMESTAFRVLGPI